jgi:hypothetical protein
VKTGSCNCSNFDANPLDDAGRAFRFLRQQSNPIAPKPLGRGAADGDQYRQAAGARPEGLLTAGLALGLALSVFGILLIR